MNSAKKRFNWKARENRKVIIDNASVDKIKVDLGELQGKYDECNQLVLPSKKRPTKKQKEDKKNTRLLSKKKRKKLEKITEKKKKNANRTSILNALAKVQATPDEFNKFESVAAVQTKGLKRHFLELKSENFEEILSNNKETLVNSLCRSKRKKRILKAVQCKLKTKNIIHDPNIVGSDDSDSTDYDSNVSNFEEKNDDSVEEVETKITSESAVNEENVVLKKEKADEKSDIKMKLNAINSKIESGEETDVNQMFNIPCNPATYIHVFRKPEIQEARLKLPILAEEQIIMENISDSDVVIIAGETGSGKTTQVPQFLYEAGYARNGKVIGITEPRRVAAISMAKRVSEEMNLSSDIVSYLIRYEGSVTPQTKIKFMTDGVLLKEIQTDFILSKYSAIILDEAHERSVYTDILIGLLSRIVRLRKKKKNSLKLIIMSATLRVEDFIENGRLFFAPPPLIKVESRQYPVSIHFSKRTCFDYLKDCYYKTCKIHNTLPDGGILVFLTGQQEVRLLVKKLISTFPVKSGRNMNGGGTNYNKSFKENMKNNRKNKQGINSLMHEVNLDKYSLVPNDDTEIDLIDEDDEDYDYFYDFDDSDRAFGITKNNFQPLWVLPLYSLLPTTKQSRVFAKPPDGCRLCVVATNVAETSLTIPNIKYVVDCGKTKKKLYDKTTGVTSFEITWCSKASANQRAGRAGRMGAGHCYRLYSSAVFNDEFPQFSEPEIMQKPIDDLILQMKSMNIVKVINFPFPTTPSILQLKAAERRLKILGALEDDSSNKGKWHSKLTKLGETMASFPLSPRYAKMLALSCQYNLMQYVICIVAALSVQQVLLHDNKGRKWTQFHRNWAGQGNFLLLGDVMVLLRAVGAAEYSKEKLEDFCLKNGLRLKAIKEIRKLRVQLINQINLNIPDFNLSVDPNMTPPSDTEAKLLRQIILSGLADHVAHKISCDEVKEDEDKRKWKRAYRDSQMEEPIFLHSNSVLKNKLPEWVVYQEVYESTKMFMRGVTAIEPEWLPIFAPSLCNLSEPLSDYPPTYNQNSGKVYCHVNGTFGRAAFPLPTMQIPFTNSVDSYKWFSVFLLNGEVFPKLKQFTNSLLSAPSCMTKSWARLQPRTELLLNTLISRQANTRDQLLNIWKEENYYLLEAYKAWLPESAHETISAIWPPI